MRMRDIVGSVIADAAKKSLVPLGVARKGRSRLWIDDHGWWLINVEFQPSGSTKGCYLNIGEQHLRVVRDHVCFEHVERPTSFVAYDDDVDGFTIRMEEVVRSAMKAVERRRDAHSEGREALRRLAVGNDDLNAGIAFALLGDAEAARARLTGAVHRAFRPQAER